MQVRILSPQQPIKKIALEEKAKELNKIPLRLDKTNKDIRKIYFTFFGKDIFEFDLA